MWTYSLPNFFGQFLRDWPYFDVCFGNTWLFRFAANKNCLELAYENPRYNCISNGPTTEVEHQQRPVIYTKQTFELQYSSDEKLKKNWFWLDLSSIANHSLSLGATLKLNCTLCFTDVVHILSYHRFCGLHRSRICCLHRKLSCSSFLLRALLLNGAARSKDYYWAEMLSLLALTYFLHFQECLQRVKTSLRFIMRPLISPWDYQKMKKALITILPSPLLPRYSWGSWP